MSGSIGNAEPPCYNYIRLGHRRLEKSRTYLAYHDLSQRGKGRASADVLGSEIRYRYSAHSVPSQGLAADFGSEKQTAGSIILQLKADTGQLMVARQQQCEMYRMHFRAASSRKNRHSFGPQRVHREGLPVENRRQRAQRPTIGICTHSR